MVGRVHIAVEDFPNSSSLFANNSEFDLKTHLLYLMSAQVLERYQQLLPEPSDEPQTEPLEVVVLDELVQIEGQQLERDAQVVAEVEVLVHVHNVGRVIRVLRRAKHSPLNHQLTDEITS
jgi:hypothetical protein